MKQLAPYVSAFISGGLGVFGKGSKQVIIQDMDYWNVLTQVAEAWKQPAERETVLECMTSRNLEAALVRKAVDHLESNNQLIDSDLFNNDDRYSRNKLYYNNLTNDVNSFQENIEKSTVAIIGCGGIGNHISSMLACSGVGKIILINDDTIELSNLTRQVLFTESDIGLNKTNVISRELKSRNSKVDISVFNSKIENESDLVPLLEADLFVVSADSHGSINVINSFCVKNKKPYINVGYLNDISVIGPFYIPGETACIECEDIIGGYSSDNEIKKRLENIEKGFRPSSFASINGVAASYAFNEIIKFIGGDRDIITRNTRVGIFANEARIEQHKIKKSTVCKVCSHQ